MVGNSPRVYISEQDKLSPIEGGFIRRIVIVIRTNGEHAYYTLDSKITNEYRNFGDFILQPVLKDDAKDSQTTYLVTHSSEDHTYVLWKRRDGNSKYIGTMRVSDFRAIGKWDTIVSALAKGLDEVCQQTRVAIAVKHFKFLKTSPMMRRIA